MVIYFLDATIWKTLHKGITTDTFLMTHPLNIQDLKREELFLLIKLLTFKTKTFFSEFAL